MDTFSWAFSNPSESGTKPLSLFRRKTEGFYSSLSALTRVIKEKEALLESFSPDSEKHFMFDSSSLKEVRKMNLKSVFLLKKSIDEEKFEEKMAHQLLFASSTRLHEVAAPLNLSHVREAEGSSPPSHPLEETKSRSLIALQQERPHMEIVAQFDRHLKSLKSSLEAFSLSLEVQNSAIDAFLSNRSNSQAFQASVDREKEIRISLNSLLQKLLSEIHSFLEQLEKENRLEKTEVKRRSQSLLNMSGRGLPALLIFHGYADTPEESRDLCRFLSQHGYSYFVPRLPGHGTSQKEHINTSIVEIREFAQHCLDFLYLKNNQQPVFITGLSIGGLLALDLAEKPENYGKIRGIIPINAPIQLLTVNAILDKIPLIDRIFSRDTLSNLLMGFAMKTQGAAVTRRNRPLHRVKKQGGFLGIFKKKTKTDTLELFTEHLEKKMQELIGQRKIASIKEPQSTRKIMEPDSEDYKKVKERIQATFLKKYGEKSLSQFAVDDLTRLLAYEFYTTLSAKGAADINLFGQEVRQKLGHITAPLLIIQAQGDIVTDPRSADMILDGSINAPSRKKETFPGQHILIVDRGNEAVFVKMVEFMAQISGASQSHKLAA